MGTYSIVNCKTSKLTIPLATGIVGPSYAGKTMSSLELSTGMASVLGGPIVYIDTEGGRALEFRSRYDFEHMNMPEPYGSLDYCNALDDALQMKPSVVIVDSISHEHEGAGGYMDVAQGELDRGVKEGSHWAKPSGYRRRLISKLMTYPCPYILCFRAKPSLDWKSVFERRSKQPEPLGFMPIGGAEFVYYMFARFLLLPENPRSKFKGAPLVESDYRGEQETIKFGPFLDHFSERHQLCKNDGVLMAKWAQGNQEAIAASVPSERFTSALAGIGAVTAISDLEAIGEMIGKLDKSGELKAGEVKALRRAYKERKGTLDANAQAAAGSVIT